MRDTAGQTSARVTEEKVRNLRLNSASGLAITAIASTGLTFGFPAHPPYAQAKIAWWVVMNLLMLTRLIELLRWRMTQDGSYRELLRLRMGVLCTALLWAFYCVYFYHIFEIYELAFSIVIVSAMAGGAATVLSGDSLIARAYALILLVPYSLVLLFDSRPPNRMLGVLGLCFAAVLYKTAQKAAQFTHDSIALRLENIAILNSMEGEIRYRINENKELLQRDSLTGLLNRNAFIDKCNELLHAQCDAAFAVYFIDLDRFKPINDNLGHRIGDKVLQEVATRLSMLRNEGSILCRWGGDEFVFLQKVENSTEATAFSERIRESINARGSIDAHQIALGASIGFSLAPLHSRSVDELIAFADMAMYVNKKSSAGGVTFFDFWMAEQVADDFHLSFSLRESIAKNQLLTFFQPVVNSQTGRCEAVEALLRWNLNGRQVSPEIFIPIAERNGFIVQLGYWVLEDALRKVREMEAAGHKLDVCVNASILQFQDASFVEQVKAFVRAADLQPERLRIELTESSFSSFNSHFKDCIRELQDFGVKIAIDDFGTGYSSLALIQSLHVNQVKIDKIFIDRLESGGLDVVRAVMVMASGLDYAVVAEGVESQEQVEILSNLGVRYLQGYWFGEPMPVESLLERLGSSALLPHEP